MCGQAYTVSQLLQACYPPSIYYRPSRPSSPLPPPQQECLEDKIDESGFSSECKEELDGIIAKRVADFKLDTPLREACEGDLQVRGGEGDTPLRGRGGAQGYRSRESLV